VCSEILREILFAYYLGHVRSCDVPMFDGKIGDERTRGQNFPPPPEDTGEEKESVGDVTGKRQRG